MRVRVEYNVAGAKRLITVLKLPLDYTPDLGEVMAVSDATLPRLLPQDTGIRLRRFVRARVKGKFAEQP